MPKRKNLNGIPHNLTKSFFGTERYYGRGYMADWLLNAARTLNLREASLDVLTGAFCPNALNLHPLVFHAKSLRDILEKELSNNGFTHDFITTAVINFQFPDPNLDRTTFYCYPLLIDRDGKRYETKRTIESAWGPPFNPFPFRISFWRKCLRVLGIKTAAGDMRLLLLILLSSLATRNFAQQRVAQYSSGKYGTAAYEHIEFWTNDGRRTKISYSYGKRPHIIALDYVGKIEFHGDSCFKVRFPNDYVLYIIPKDARLKIADSAFKYDKIFSWEYEGPIDGRGTFCSVCTEDDADAMKLLRSAYLR